jgi:excisionase family DNA binding protein
MTADEVAAELRVTSRTVRRWANAGMIERVRLGGRLVRYRRESIEALIHPRNESSPAGEAGLDGDDRAAIDNVQV